MQNLLFDLIDKDSFWFRKEKCNYYIVDSEELCVRLSSLLDNFELISFDVETTGRNIDSGKLVGFSVSAQPGQAFYIPISHSSGKNLELSLYQKYIKPHLENKRVLGHNLKFDYKFAKCYLGTNINCSEDTFVISKLMETFDFHGLKPLCELLFGFDACSLEDLLSMYGIKVDKMDFLSPGEIFEYCCQDVDLTLRLYYKLIEEFNWKRNFIYDEEIKLITSLGRMELRGVAINRSFLEESKKEYEQQVKELGEKIIDIVGNGGRINLDSNEQIMERISQIYPRKVVSFFKYTEKSNKIRLDEESLKYYFEKLEGYIKEHQEKNLKNVFGLILERRKMVSLLNKYILPWITMLDTRKSNIIYTNYNSLGARTGRTSSNDPNLQNVTPKIRSAIVPRDNYYFVAMDYSQVEYRIFVAMAELDHLVKEIEENDADIHALACSLLFNIDLEEVKTRPDLRSFAKNLNFGVIYGMGASSLARNLGIEIAEAEKLMADYNKKFLRDTPWFNRVIDFAKKYGYVMTSFGRKSRIDNINIEIPKNGSYKEVKQANALLSSAKRKAINTPVQGTCADVVKMAINKVFSMIDREGLDVHPCVTVHDDILFEVNNKYEVDYIVPKLKECLELFFKNKITLKVDYNVSKVSWGALKE